MINCTYCNNETNNKKFCSRSCAQSYNNKHFPKRKPKGKCKECQGPRLSGYTYCSGCWSTRVKDIRLGEAIYERHHRSSAYALVRSRARSVVKPEDKSCENCGYNKHVEVCHIKPISSFEETVYLSVINSQDNLVLLCPNCHWEFDNGHLEL